MKLIIPMAGRGTRVRPHSHTVPKPLLPVAGKMIIERIIETFIRTLDRKIEEIVFILGPDFGQPIKDRLAEMGSRHNAKTTFRIQFPALGTAHAVTCANEDLSGEVIVAFADTIFDSKEMFNLDGADSVIWLKRVEDPSRFGVAVHKGETITGFVEKPKEFISDLAIIGVYYFRDWTELKRQVNRVIEQDLKGPSGEYFLTAALDNMIKEGNIFKIATVDEWLDCGTLPAWLETTGIITQKEYTPADASRFPGSSIVPPVYIGPGVNIENSAIGPNVSIESGSSIHNSVIKNSIIRENSRLENVKTTGSTVGAHVNLKNISGNIHIGDHSEVVLE